MQYAQDLFHWKRTAASLIRQEGWADRRQRADRHLQSHLAAELVQKNLQVLIASASFRFLLRQALVDLELHLSVGRVTEMAVGPRKAIMSF